MPLIIKITILALLTQLSLISDTIVGSWEIDKKKTQHENSNVDINIVGITIAFFDSVNIYDNHTIISEKADFNAKWEKDGTQHVAINKSTKTAIDLLDNNSLKMVIKTIDASKIPLFYKRVKTKNKTTLDQSTTELKLNHIYKSQKIAGEYRFLLVDKEDKKLYFLQTDKRDTITIAEIKSATIEGKGSVFSDDPGVYIKNGHIFTHFSDQKVEVLSSNQLKYYGALYTLQR